MQITSEQLDAIHNKLDELLSEQRRQGMIVRNLAANVDLQAYELRKVLQHLAIDGEPTGNGNGNAHPTDPAPAPDDQERGPV